MRVERIKIENILGIESLEFEPGQITVVSGPNGAGKTSVLEAIKATLQGGHDASLVRHGAGSGEAVLVLDDGTEIRKKMTAGAGKLYIGQGADLKRQPQKWLDTILDPGSFNPVSFLAASPKQRRDELVSGLKIEIAAPDSDAKTMRWDELESHRKSIYDGRTGLNRALKEVQGGLANLQAIAPEMVSAEELQARYDATSRELVDIAGHKSEDLATVRTQVEAKWAGTIQVLEQERNGIRDRLRDAHKVEAARSMKAGYEARAAELLDEIQEMNNELKAVDEAKVRALENLQIPGVEIEGDEIRLDGIPFDRVNMARRLQFVLELAVMRAGPLGLVCVDGLEHMDCNGFELFKEAARATTCQFIVTRVSDGSDGVERLTIEVE